MLNKEINISNIYIDSQKLIVLLDSARLGLSFLKPMSCRFKNTQHVWKHFRILYRINL